MVSIVIPAFKAEYFEFSLVSALEQTYSNIEIVICDSNRDGSIAEILSKYNDPRIKYFFNSEQLREGANTVECIKRSSGEFIKFLHDDDVLHATCVERMVNLIECEENISLVSSRRTRIDYKGEILQDILATSFPFSSDVIVNGSDLISFLGDYTINFIGEPSCILARRSDLLDISNRLMGLNGKPIHWVGDLAMYVKLLRRGNLGFIADPLTKFRVSPQQFSQQGRDKPGIGEQGHEDFRQAIRDLGWYRSECDNRLVNVAPITKLKARVFKSVNLLQAIYRSSRSGSINLPHWLDKRVTRPSEKLLIAERFKEFDGGPKIAIVILNGSQVDLVKRTIDSILNTSIYKNFEVLVPEKKYLVPDDSRVIFFEQNNNNDDVITINSKIRCLSSEWFVIVEPGVEFTRSGLMLLALDLIGAPSTCMAVYADELMRSSDDRLGVALRPDFNLDYFLSLPSGMYRHWLLRRDAFLQKDGFSNEFGRAYEFEYQLRLIAENGLGCIGHVSEPLLTADVVHLDNDEDVRRVIVKHLSERGYKDAVVDSTRSGRYEINYGHPESSSVSVIVLVKDRYAQIRRCIETLLENTLYENYEVLLLDHANNSPEITSWLAGVEALGVDHLRVLRFDENLNRAQVLNNASTQARGEFLLWLSDGAAIMGKDWLQQLLNHGQRPEVGTVSGKLLSADGRVKHAGILLGLGGPAGRVFEDADMADAGYMQRLQVDQNVSAGSCECLLIHQQLFNDLGGFDISPLLARWIDVDLCLRVQQSGYLNVWTPRVQLLIDSSGLGVAPSTSEEDEMYARWLPVLANDPAYNRCFSLSEAPGFQLEDARLSWRPLDSWRPLPVVLAHNADSQGCGHYRVIQPFNSLRDAGLIDGVLINRHLMPSELARLSPDVVVLQRQISESGLEAIRRIKRLTSSYKVFELDDYLPNLPLKNAHRKTMPKDVLRSIRQGLGFVDRFIVSTDALADAFAGMHADIHVVENRLPVDWWINLSSKRRISVKPRVGWAGGISHAGDLDLIADVVKELASEVDWVFFGMCPDRIRPYVREYHPGVDIYEYPKKLASLSLDLALAPVEQNLFNECKSNLRLLEYGACGYPVIASDVKCYQGSGLPVTLVKNRFKDWVDAIRQHLADLDGAAVLGDQLRAAVISNWMLEGQGLERWKAAWVAP